MSKPTPDTGKWRGHTVYRCRLCAFDTLEKAVFEDHYRKVHAPLEVIEARRKQTGDLHAMTVADLKTRAEREGVALDSSAKKADIIAALEAAEKGN